LGTFQGECDSIANTFGEELAVCITTPPVNSTQCCSDIFLCSSVMDSPRISSIFDLPMKKLQEKMKELAEIQEIMKSKESEIENMILIEKTNVSKTVKRLEDELRSEIEQLRLERLSLSDKKLISR